MIDISRAATESFFRYHNFHEQFNSTIQINLAGLLTLRRIVDTSNSVNILNSLVLGTSLRTTSKPRSLEPVKTIDNVIFSQGLLTIVEAVSAFDSFTIDFIANLAQFSVVLRTAGKPFNHAHTAIICDHANPVEFSKCCFACAIQYGANHKLHSRLEDLCDDLSIMSSDLSELLPFFHYFRLVRNCIVHYAGRANKELVEHSESKTFIDSLIYWNKITKKGAAKLPVLNVGQTIQLTMMEHSILASSVCYKIAQLLNKKAAPFLGEEGFIHMSAFYSLFCAYHDYRRAEYKNSHAPLLHFLTRYRVQSVQRDDVVATAKKIGIWADVVKRSQALFPKIKLLGLTQLEEANNADSPNMF